MGGVVLVGPGHPVARDRAEHDLGVDRRQVLVAEAPASQASWSHRLDHRIGITAQVLEDRHALVGPQIQRDRTLAAVDVEVHERDALDDGPGHVAHIVALRRLDLDDLCAEVDQGVGDLGRTEGGALDDADAGEWCRAGHGTSLKEQCLRLPDGPSETTGCSARLSCTPIRGEHHGHLDHRRLRPPAPLPSFDEQRWGAQHRRPTSDGVRMLVMDDHEIPEHAPVDEARRSRLAMAALAILMRPSTTPLERQWAQQVWDLCWALADERGSGSR